MFNLYVFIIYTKEKIITTITNNNEEELMN